MRKDGVRTRSCIVEQTRTSTADPSAFHAIDLSVCSSVPKIDHVAPASVETKNGLAPLLLKSKAPANICLGSTGLTAMLGSEF
jgi:hypothetical protein